MSPRHSVSYTIPGTPRPKGSRVSGFTKTGRQYSRESNPKAAEAYKAMKEQLKLLHTGPALKPPYHVELTFLFDPPQKPSWPRTGDCDKYARLVLDACTAGKKDTGWAGVIEDDRHVLELSARKAWSEGPGKARTEITVHEAGH